MDSRCTILDFAFRMGPLSIGDANLAIRTCQSFAVKSRERRDWKGIVISVDLVEGVDYSELSRVIELLRLSRDKYDVFVGVASDEDSMIIEVPEYISELVQCLNARLVFSYTVS